MKDYARQVTLTAAICVLAIAAFETIKGGSSNASARAVTVSGTSQVLHVTGSSTVHVRPDEAVIEFQVRGHGHSLAAAENVASRKMTTLIGAISADDVARKDMQTHDQNASRLSAGVYVAYQSLTVTVRHILAAGKLVAAGTSAGARSTEGPVYSLSGQQQAYGQALAAAVKEAHMRAQAIAAAAGLRITGVVSIQQVQQQPTYYPGPVYDAAAVPNGIQKLAATVPTRPGRRDVSASVTIVYSYGSS
jgi:uncharacterized protein YggE